jgi:hypothetical protein
MWGRVWGYPKPMDFHQRKFELTSKYTTISNIAKKHRTRDAR